jgi:DeoR family fructose operon transcriptional repressor
MLRDERTERILQYVTRNGFARIQEIMDICKVSRPTVLRDLRQLEQEGLLIRTHGGAKSIRKTTAFEPRQSWKENQRAEDKRKIAALAKELVEDGDTILLDSGTTTLMLARELATFKNITVITNDIMIAMTLSGNDDIQLVMPGGQRRKGVYSLIGPFAEMILGQLNVDKAFIGADYVDLERGITNSNIEETTIKKTILDISKKTILLVDSSKFNSVGFVKIADLERVDTVITDEGIHNMPPLLDQMIERNIDVRIAR